MDKPHRDAVAQDDVRGVLADVGPGQRAAQTLLDFKPQRVVDRADLGTELGIGPEDVTDVPLRVAQGTVGADSGLHRATRNRSRKRQGQGHRASHRRASGRKYTPRTGVG